MRSLKEAINSKQQHPALCPNFLLLSIQKPPSLSLNFRYISFKLSDKIEHVQKQRPKPIGIAVQSILQNETIHKHRNWSISRTHALYLKLYIKYLELQSNPQNQQSFLKMFQTGHYPETQNSGQHFTYDKEMMGTTIVAFKFDGGVIACADTRTSSGGVWVVDRAADKIDYLHEHIVVLRSGEASASQQAAHKARFLLDSHSNQIGKLPMVKTASKMLSKMNYEKGLQCGFIVAGWDPYKGGQVFSVNLGGATIERQFTMGGSGSGFIYGFCDANFRPNMSLQEAKQFAIQAVSLAMSRDGSSGGAIRLAVVDKDGIHKQFHDYNTLPYK